MFIMKIGNAGMIFSRLLPYLEKEYDIDYKLVLTRKEKRDINLIEKNAKRKVIVVDITHEIFKSFFIKADIFHIDSPRYFLAGLFFRKRFLRKKINVIIHFHGSDVRNPSLSLFLIRKLILPKVTNTILYSTPDLYLYIAPWIPKDSYLIWLPNPVDTNTFRPLPEIEKTDEILVYTRISPEKGIDEIIRKICNDGNKYVLIKFGEKKWIEYYINFCKKLNCKNIRWIDPIPKDQLPKFLNKFEYVLPQHSLPTKSLKVYGVSELEAAACGCKIIGLEWLTREYVKKHHSIEKVGEKLAKIYKAVNNSDLDILEKLSKEYPVWNSWKITKSYY